MAINKNHEFEELNGVKCGIVERGVSEQRMQYLKDLLEFNKYEVIVVSKGEGDVPITYTVGVTDYTFNPMNAVFGRVLKNRRGEVVGIEEWRSN